MSCGENFSSVFDTIRKRNRKEEEILTSRRTVMKVPRSAHVVIRPFQAFTGRFECVTS
jgi:hypothetical protein